MSQEKVDVKEKILSIFNSKGPSIPSRIASEIGMNLLFTSAYLSELTSEKKLKTSSVRVGSSPVYFLPGQEPLLESFAEELKGKEKEAFNLLKDKKFLVDKSLEPAIRVALRSLKDFAIMFERNGEVIWKYFTSKESDFSPRPVNKEIKVVDEKKEIQEIKKEEIEEKKPVPKVEKKKTPKKKTASKKNDKFFNKIKDFLSKKSIEISSIEGLGKNDVSLIIRDKGEEKLLFAYNKKRINENDILKAHKKSSELNLPYIVLSLGDIPKKIDSFIKAIKDLSEIGKLE